MHPEPRQESESRDTRVQQSSVAEGAGKGAAKDPQQQATSGYSPGCGTGCLFWLVISVLWQVIWYHQSWSQAFHHILGPLWTFGSEIAWPILFHILKLALVCGGVVLLVFLLTKAEKWLASRNSDPDLIAGYLNSFLPLKLFLKLPKLFTESRSMVEKSATGKTHWSNAPLTLLVTAAALFGLEALVALPPS